MRQMTEEGGGSEMASTFRERMEHLRELVGYHDLQIKVVVDQVYAKY